MGKRVVITKQKIKDREYRVTALFEDHQMLEVSCDDVTEDSLLGNIYIGKIRRIVEKIGCFCGNCSRYDDVSSVRRRKRTSDGKTTPERQDDRRR